MNQLNGTMALAVAIAGVDTSNFRAQSSSTVTMFILLDAYTELTSTWNEQLNQDSMAYFVASATITQDHPEDTAKAGAAYQKLANDQSKSDQDTAVLNNMLQKGKTQLKLEGDASGNIDSMEAPLTQLLHFIYAALRK